MCTNLKELEEIRKSTLAGIKERHSYLSSIINELEETMEEENVNTTSVEDNTTSVEDQRDLINEIDEISKELDDLLANL